MSKFAYRKHPAYAGFAAYMNGQFSELAAADEGRKDPRKLCFLDMGVPEELIFFLWLAARREALEEAAKICELHSTDFNRRRRTSDNPTYMEGKSDGAEACASALYRALSKDQTK